MKRTAVVRAIRDAGLTLAVLLTLNPGALAAEKATVTVLAIRASQTKGSIDPQLKGIADKLKGVVAFKSLKLLSRQSRSGPYGEKQTFALPEKMELVVTPLEERDGSVRLGIVLLRPRPNAPPRAEKKTVLNMKATLQRKRGFPIVGPALEEGRLVLVVSAE